MLTALRIAAVVELASLVVLLVNLATVHVAGVAAAVGPVHGAAYVVVVASVLLLPVPVRVRLVALVPGLGGVLALRAVGAVDAGRPGPVDGAGRWG
jgi:uncharacterized protein DUF3817